MINFIYSSLLLCVFIYEWDNEEDMDVVVCDLVFNLFGFSD